MTKANHDHHPDKEPAVHHQPPAHHTAHHPGHHRAKKKAEPREKAEPAHAPAHGPKHRNPRAQKNRKGYWIGGGALALILVLALFMTLHRRSKLSGDAHQLTQQENAGRKVELATVQEAPPEQMIALTGETRAFYAVTLYARVSGYLDTLLVDIGDKVKQGQLLAHVESPEQEQAYNSARADAFNKHRIAERATILRKRALISQQQEDQAVADDNVAQANLVTQKTIRDYQDIRAPFDGEISNRFVDLGWLLQNASGSQAASQPLFAISQSDRLRVFMYVDQGDAPFVHVNDPVEIMVPGQNPAQAQSKVTAKITMIAGELDPRTRTLLTETIIPNADNKIVAGSFVEAQIKIHMPQMMKLPIQALVMRDNHPFVSVVDGQGKTRFTKIDLAENDGQNILIRSGVQAGQKVALNTGNTITDGQKVRASAPTQQAGQVGDEKPGQQAPNSDQPGAGSPSAESPGGAQPPSGDSPSGGQPSSAQDQPSGQNKDSGQDSSQSSSSDKGASASQGSAQGSAEKGQPSGQGGASKDPRAGKPSDGSDDSDTKKSGGSS